MFSRIWVCHEILASTIWLKALRTALRQAEHFPSLADDYPEVIGQCWDTHIVCYFLVFFLMIISATKFVLKTCQNQSHSQTGIAPSPNKLQRSVRIHNNPKKVRWDWMTYMHFPNLMIESMHESLYLRKCVREQLIKQNVSWLSYSSERWEKWYFKQQKQILTYLNSIQAKSIGNYSTF